MHGCHVPIRVSCENQVGWWPGSWNAGKDWCQWEVFVEGLALWNRRVDIGEVIHEEADKRDVVLKLRFAGPGSLARG